MPYLTLDFGRARPLAPLHKVLNKKGEAGQVFTNRPGRGSTLNSLGLRSF